MTNVNGPRFWCFWSKTWDCFHLSFFITLIDYFYSRHSIQSKCWDAWEAAKKNSTLFDHHLHEIFGLHSGTDYRTGPNFPNTRMESVAQESDALERLREIGVKTPWEIWEHHNVHPPSPVPPAHHDIQRTGLLLTSQAHPCCQSDPPSSRWMVWRRFAPSWQHWGHNSIPGHERKGALVGPGCKRWVWHHLVTVEGVWWEHIAGQRFSGMVVSCFSQSHKGTYTMANDHLKDGAWGW